MSALAAQAALFLEKIQNFINYEKYEKYETYITLLLTPGWWQLVICFFICSFLMITRLNAVEKNGFEGTIIGTLIMPYFSGFPNLCFAYLVAQTDSNGSTVLENCLVNNVTNLTIILAIPSMLWGLNLFCDKKHQNQDKKIDRLSLLLSILALIFFSISLFFVSKDGIICANDGMLLMGIFFFWQLYHVFDVLKNNTRKSRTIKKRIFLDLIVIGLCAWAIFFSIENFVQLISLRSQGFFSRENLGFLSGILMVFPNAFLAVYYSAVKQPEIAYSSQIGDCHICIPLCIGIFSIYSPIMVSASFEISIFIIIGASVGHFAFMLFAGKLPRFAGIILTCLYLFYIYKNL